MNKTIRRLTPLLTALFLTACGHSPPTHFYTLASIEAAPSNAVSARAMPVTMGTVDLPEILNRNQLIRRPSDDQVIVLQFDRWAAPLDENIAKTLTVDLEHILPNGTVIHSNGFPDDVATGIIDLYIDRFDADPAGHVTFDVAWTVTAGNPQKAILRRSEHIAEDADNGSPAAVVQAMSRAVADLSLKIAAELPTH